MIVAKLPRRRRDFAPRLRTMYRPCTDLKAKGAVWMSELRFAVLIDGDNISAKFLEPILTEVGKAGTIVIKRVYADWTADTMRAWKWQLQDTPIKPVQQFRYGQNATDGALIMDAIELVSANPRPVNAFCIVSSDSDYYGLALRLREHGMHVMGIGRRNTKQLMVKSCDRFVYVENLFVAGAPQTPSASDEISREPLTGTPVEHIIMSAYQACEPDDEGWLLLSKLGNAIYKEYPDFDPRSYNHARLIDVVKSYPDLFELRRSDTTPPVYWMRVATKDEAEAQVKTGKIKRFGAAYGFIETESGDYFFTLSNLSPEQRHIKVKKGMKVSFKEFKAPDPSGETTEERNGRAMEVQIID